MYRERSVYLEDIRMASEDIESFVEGKTVGDYAADNMLRSAVERQLLIIGEAVAQMIQTFPDAEASISNARGIVDSRNRLVHAYYLVADDVVWNVVRTHLPRLKHEVEMLLQQFEAPE